MTHSFHREHDFLIRVASKLFKQHEAFYFGQIARLSSQLTVLKSQQNDQQNLHLTTLGNI